MDFNTTLTSLEDMSYVTAMGNDTMDNFNTTLTSLEDMSNATSMGNDTMDNFNTTLTSLEDMSNATSMGNDTMDNFNTTLTSLEDMSNVINLIIICIELPVICWAVFAMYHQVKVGHVTHVYVINLLISDLIQIIGRFMDYLQNYGGIVLLVFGLGASILFMMCIALERYLLVVHPLWYRYRRTTKHSILISLAVYVFDVLLFIAGYFIVDFLSPEAIIIGCATFLILPLPLLVFFLVATWRVLSHSISVPHQEKKRIMGTLALVLLIYLVLFFPSLLLLIFRISPSLFEKYDHLENILFVATLFLYISPLMDALLYILIKKDSRYTLKVPHCCRRDCTRKESRETSTVTTENVTSI